MLPDKIETGLHTTADDLALNVIHDALAAGKIVRYTGSVEKARGSQVLAMERCEFHDARDPFKDCCHRQQAIVWTKDAELRHVAAFSLTVEEWEVVTCASCGESGPCTPWSDYYVTPLLEGGGRVCEGCFGRLVREHLSGDATA